MTFRRFRPTAALWALLFVLVPAGAYAQTGAASITGLVVDETGGALPGVTVTATNQATNVEYVAISNEAGNYTITSVPIGTYIIKAELTGFRTSTTAVITLEAKQVRRLDFKMTVGAIAETVEVTGVSPILQTETVTVGEVISGNTATALPLNGRNASQLALLLPGAMTVNPAGFTGVPGGGAQPAVRQRQPGAGEQLHGGRSRRQRDDRQRRRVPAQPGCGGRGLRRDQQLHGRHRQRGRRGHQQRAEVGQQHVQGQRVRVLPQQRPRREHVGEQPVRRAQGGTPAGHLRRHLRRAAHEGQAVLLRRLPGVAPGRAGLRDGVGGARGVAARRPVEHLHADHRPAHRTAVPGQPDPGRVASAPSRAPSSATRPTTRCPTPRSRASRATTSARP